MEKLLKQFEEKDPEIIFEWKDTETDAEGWIVINSLRGGAAAGGTASRRLRRPATFSAHGSTKTARPSTTSTDTSRAHSPAKRCASLLPRRSSAPCRAAMLPG